MDEKKKAEKIAKDVAKKIKGSNGKIISLPSDRFINIEKWYIDTQRVWK